MRLKWLGNNVQMIKCQFTQQKKPRTTVKIKLKIYNQKIWVFKHNKQNAQKTRPRKARVLKMEYNYKTIRTITLNVIVVL